MRIERIELRLIEIPLLEPFEISCHRFESKTALVLKAWDSDGLVGWAEGEHLRTPWYVPETVESGWSLLSGILIRDLIGLEFANAGDIADRLSWIQGNQLSLSAIDCLVRDLLAKRAGVSLAASLGARRDKVPAGTSIGLCASPAALVDRVAEAAEAGYARVKVKIKPGKDAEYLESVRNAFPDIPLMVDANSSYDPRLEEDLAGLDRFALMMIEQPYPNGDLVDHARLAARISTPVCLDESIHSMHEARAAAALGSCRVINIKPPRIGGPGAAAVMQSFLAARGIAAWCGGMLETGIGRAVNIACAALPGFSLPGDFAAPRTYLKRDIVRERFDLLPGGMIAVPQGPGIGVEVDEDYLRHVTSRVEVFS